MTPKDYAVSLIAQGIPTSQVAAACGVDDSYISQLKADPEVQQRVAEARAEHVVTDAKFDDTLERAEALALEKIEKNLPFANMGQALAAFRILNGARRRKDQFAQTEHNVSVTVALTLPQAAIPRYITNTKNEIIEVEGQTMISATPKTLDDILSARATGALLPKITELEKAANRLDTLSAPVMRTAKRLPPELSADML
jgi:hypothetical protein